MELVDLYDVNRVPLGRTAERYGPKAPGEYRTVVHLCIFDTQGRMLIQHRTPEKFIWPDRWDVAAAGGVDAGETSRQAAERELREELGLDWDLGTLRPVVTVTFDGGFDDFYVVTRDVNLNSLTLQKEEVSEVQLVSLEKAEEMTRSGAFIPYPEGFLRFLYSMQGREGF